VVDAGDGAGQPRVVGLGPDSEFLHTSMMRLDRFRRKAVDAILRLS
jgi:hypothetical protein